MAHFTATQVQTWLESTKLNVTSIEVGLEAQVAGEVLGRLTQTYAQYVPAWIDATTTPEVVQQVMSMQYAGWMYDRAYSEAGETTATYGKTLRGWSTNLLNDILKGSVAIVEIAPNKPAVAPVFYPTDVSSTNEALWANTDCNDQSLGPAKFTVDKVF